MTDAQRPDFKAYAPLASRLSSTTTFTETLDELRDCFIYCAAPTDIDDPMLILNLVEVARDTLLHRGVRIQPAGSCPKHLQHHKDIYFSFLRNLKLKRGLFPGPSLQDKITRLTLPLIGTTLLRRSPRTYAATRSNNAMPPPRTIPFHPQPLPKRRALDAPRRLPDALVKRVCVRTTNHTADKLENTSENEDGVEDDDDGYDRNDRDKDENEGEDEEKGTRHKFVMKPLRGRFGISCGSTTSMYRRRV
ncbi:hypothetical protein CYLTODRAFT_422349 [Cylindrobasidium torrendii FP15055 ss-10]|uniref:Uncharacterized protein n=1 Tax=Cylindrobasidium torrendii FP15055 ss-10 TaxID=1314674 RepID=A0A0D7BBS1_9AGAR|nr:hypothetical protein CYLTODRAFT_422349 [Cylindrobasidium torrendii FP15055 ss-10]